MKGTFVMEKEYGYIHHKQFVSCDDERHACELSAVIKGAIAAYRVWKEGEIIEAGLLEPIVKES